MTGKPTNQFTGRNAPGFRFCFHVRAIAHRSIFLPCAMKNLPQIRRLLSGESPLTVFDCDSYPEARRRFAEFRKKYDFAFWAISEFRIRDINDADHIIPLRLNRYQHYIIDIMLKCREKGVAGRYAVTKSFSRCGLTTCVNAYIIWSQTFQCRNSSYLCSSSVTNLLPLKADFCRYFKREIVPTDKWIYVPAADSRAYFNTYRNPNFARGINLGYVHFADMSKWKDPSGKLSVETHAASISGVLRSPFTLVVLEGNIPKEERFRYDFWHNFHLPFFERMRMLGKLSKCPFLLNHIANIGTSNGRTGIIHINLDHIDDPTRRLTF